MHIISIIIISCLVWLGCGLLAAGAFNAENRGEFHENYENSKWARRGCAHMIGIGLFGGPIALAMSPFVTGFYQHGWTLSCKPHEARK